MRLVLAFFLCAACPVFGATYAVTTPGDSSAIRIESEYFPGVTESKLKLSAYSRGGETLTSRVFTLPWSKGTSLLKAKLEDGMAELAEEIVLHRLPGDTADWKPRLRSWIESVIGIPTAHAAFPDEKIMLLKLNLASLCAFLGRQVGSLGLWITEPGFMHSLKQGPRSCVMRLMGVPCREFSIKLNALSVSILHDVAVQHREAFIEYMKNR